MGSRIATLVIAGLLAAPAALLPSASNAATIVDTGPGPGGNPGGTTLNSSQGLAAEFSVQANVAVNSVELWMVAGSSGTFTAAIFTDGGDIPGSELFSSQFSGPVTPAAWAGPTGLSWNLAPGTYWAVFDVRAGQNGAGYAPSPSASPLSNEAFTIGSSWRGYDDLNLGVRIRSLDGTVPEPGTLALLGLGLASLAAGRRRKH